MEKNNFVPCPDRIEVDDAFEEMSIEQLQTLKSVIEMCKGCPGCNSMLSDIEKELSSRKSKE